MEIWVLLDDYYDLLDMTSLDDLPNDEQDFLSELIDSMDKDNILIAIAVLQGKPRCTRYSLRLTNKNFRK